MAFSSILVDYLGEGLASARPASPPISPTAVAFYYATDTHILSIWNGSAWVNAAIARNVGELMAQFVLGAIVVNGTFHFSYKAPYPGTISSLNSVSTTGTFTIAVNINGSPVTGLSAVGVTSTPTTTSASGANTFAAGDDITGVISAAASSPTNAVLNLNVTWS